MMMMMIIIIIIIFINFNWVTTRWQWLYYMYTNMERKKKKIIFSFHPMLVSLTNKGRNGRCMKHALMRGLYNLIQNT